MGLGRVKSPKCHNTHRVEAPGCVTEFAMLDSDLMEIKRIQNVSGTTKLVEGFGPQWHLFVLDDPKGKIAIKSKNGFVRVTPKMAVFVPKNGLVEWQLFSGRLKWRAYRSNKNCKSLPSQSSLIQMDKELVFDGWGDVQDFFNGKEIACLGVEKSENQSILAQRTKFYIDSNFTGNISLIEIARVFGVTINSLSRAFRSRYGITPTKYKNMLRVYKSLNLIIEEEFSVTRSCYESGFNDYSRFARNVRSVTSTSPKSFRIAINSNGVRNLI